MPGALSAPRQSLDKPGPGFPDAHVTSEAGLEPREGARLASTQLWRTR